MKNLSQETCLFSFYLNVGDGKAHGYLTVGFFHIKKFKEGVV
ncbi:MAG: hypothetical protein PWQ67_1848 [Clostridia bacterium]|nr:hypothetical protein [Clostridia bacterium]MDN5323394.1 hypothetical protein [Clostridia bacterium]